MDWNFGDLLDATARIVPGDRPALIRGGRSIDWANFDARTNRLARALRAAGLQPGARVAILARNLPEFVEIAAATYKARLCHVTVNYRYTTAEIGYVLDDCGAEAIFFQGEFSATLAPLFSARPALTVRVCIGSPQPADTFDYEEWVTTGASDPLGISRSPDDGYLSYTGGTTGRPKGVMWRGADARGVQLESPLLKSEIRTMADHATSVGSNPLPGRVIPACPLMHGAGLNSSSAELMGGGTVILLTSKRFDAVELWDAAERHAATRILIVGDVFARPMAQALDEHPGRWNLSALRVISSSGLMWSEAVKGRLVRHLPNVSLVDILGASEASGFGYAITTGERSTPTGLFEPGRHTVLIDAHSGRLLPPGAVGEGLLARSSPIALGYYHDAAKTAANYRCIDGIRYAVPGDVAERDSTGRLRLIGRGDMCINTGGEKVFPEEIEEALKLVACIEDALVLGVPDPVWGQAVAALVRTRGGYDEAAARQAMQVNLAAYKIPKFILPVDELPRHASGKADYRNARRLIEAQLAGLAPRHDS